MAAAALGPHRVRGVAFLILVASGYAWATYQNFTASVPHGAAVPALAAGATDLDGSGAGHPADRQRQPRRRDAGRAGRAAHRPRRRHGQHRHDDDPASARRRREAVDHLLPARLLGQHPRPRQGQAQLRLRRRLLPGEEQARERARRRRAPGSCCTLRTLSGLTGLHIDHYLQVNLLGFYRISEAIGGVTVCLKHAQNADDRHATRSASGYSGIDLPAGVSTIKGEQALAFVRQRHGLPHGDLDRIKRQQYFLSAAFRKIASAGELLNPFKLHDLLDAVSSSLLTDPSLDLLSLARSFELLGAGDISFATLPNNGSQVIYPTASRPRSCGVDYAAVPGFIRVGHRPARRPGLAKVDAGAAVDGHPRRAQRHRRLQARHPQRRTS